MARILVMCCMLCGCVNFAGWQCAISKLDSHPCSHMDTLKDYLETKTRREYFRHNLAQIENGVMQGDYTSARDLLMTSKLQDDFLDKFGGIRPCCESSKYQYIIHYLIIAVNTLPQIGGVPVVDLLYKYYYGEDFDQADKLDKRLVEMMVMQLIIGPYVEPAHRKVSGHIRVEEDKRQVKSGTYGAYVVTYDVKSAKYLWSFEFRQFEMGNGTRVWLPTKWDSIGYID